MNYKLRLYETDPIDAGQLKTGISVEKEHRTMYQKIRDWYEEHSEFPDEDLVYEWVARDHLREVPDYYKKLLDAGL